MRESHKAIDRIKRIASMSESDAKSFLENEKDRLTMDMQRSLALRQWMQDVTSLLCYQPDIPLLHMESLVKSLDNYMKKL